jgi:hypothetical protein
MITLCDYMLPILRKSLLCTAHKNAQRNMMEL